MLWRCALSRNLLDPLPDAETKRYLRAIIPPFKAPTNARAWAREIPKLRRQLLDKVYLRGFPPSIVNGRPRVVWGEILRPDPSYRVRKLRYKIYPDFWIPALWYEPVGRAGKRPVVLTPMGHHGAGKAVNQAMCANLARRGMLTLNLEFIGMGELGGNRSHCSIAHINLTGLAGVGLFYLALKKGLDLALAHRQADRRRVAVTGCSGGGWQSIVISALDPRITLSVPVAGYTSVRARVEVEADIGDLEQAPPDQAAIADYQTLTAMLAPRPALLILNEMDDCCFATARARPVIYDAVKPTYRAFGAEDRFATYSNIDPGTHNYDEDNRSQFYQFVNKHFGLDTPPNDLHRPEEILTETAINVGLPECQETFLSIALKRARKLNAHRKAPRNLAERRQLRARLTDVIRLLRYSIRDRQVCQTGHLSQHLFRIGPWSVPVTVHAARDAEVAELWIADGGRAGLSGRTPSPSSQVYAADILGTGESKPRWSLQMLLECAGQRILGIQTGQILACARWAHRQTGISHVDLVSDGLRTYVASLLAAALEPGLFRKLTVSSPVGSLAEVIEIPCGYHTDQPLFCFGLLEAADIRELKMLLEGVELIQPGRGVSNECVVGGRRA